MLSIFNNNNKQQCNCTVIYDFWLHLIRNAAFNREFRMIGDLQDNAKWRHGNLLVNGCCVTQTWDIFQCRNKLRFWWDDANEYFILENNDELNYLAHYNYSEIVDKSFNPDTLFCLIANQSFLCLLFYVLVERKGIQKDPPGDQLNDLPQSIHWIGQENHAILISPWNCKLIYNEYWICVGIILLCIFVVV
jgi:hypothetical protein